jgi:manganese efflux pump family protein
MDGTLKIAMVAGCMAAVVLAAGCGAQQGSARRASLPGCAAYGVRAIERHVTVTRVPAACRGLTRAEINQAVSKAVDTVAGGRRKVAWRRLAVAVGARLARLVTTPEPATRALPGPRQSGSVRRPGTGHALAVAALVSWLLTAGIGSCLLIGWFAPGGTGRRRSGPGSPPPAVIAGHFGLAATGLVVWIAYLAAGQVFLAWTAVGLLLAVAGLGMATVSVGLGDPVRAAVAGAVTSAGMAEAVSPGSRAPGVAEPGGTPGGMVEPGGRPPVLLILGHGALAMATLLLALLAAVGATGR